MISQLPSLQASAAGKLHAGMPSLRPADPFAFPCESKSCQPIAPPFCQPVPSAQTSSVSLSAFAAAAGCFCPPPLAGVVGGPTWPLFESMAENQTRPLVSQAATVRSAPAEPSQAELMGQV